MAAGVHLNDRDAPIHNPETFETNVPGVFVAGGAIAGVDTGTIFIENGRFHGEKIVEVIAGRVSVAVVVNVTAAASARRNGLMRDLRQARRPRHHDLHLQQFDQRLGAASQAFPFEQRLLLERIQVEILGERIDQILI